MSRTAPGRYVFLKAVVRAVDGSIDTVLQLSSLTASQLATSAGRLEELVATFKLS